MALPMGLNTRKKLDVKKTWSKQVIAALGGSAKVAIMIGREGRGGTRLVDNWRRRGIPDEVLDGHSRVFEDYMCILTERQSKVISK